MAKKYLIFDLDGTLIDSLPDMCEEMSLFLQDHGCRKLTVSETKEAIGNGARAMLGKAFEITTGAPLSKAELDEKLALWLERYAHAQMNKTRVFDGVKETLEALRNQGYKLSICTNKPPLPTKAILKKLALEKYFDVILDAESLPVRKPYPEPLWEAIKRMGGSNQEAVMIGDSEPDCQAARNAGISAVLVSFGYANKALDEIDKDALIDDFKDLESVLQTL